MVPHAAPSTRESASEYGFDPEEYPVLAEAADHWAEVRGRRLRRWRLRLRRMM
jgi:hypothetical protein